MASRTLFLAALAVLSCADASWLPWTSRRLRADDVPKNEYNITKDGTSNLCLRLSAAISVNVHYQTAENEDRVFQVEVPEEVTHNGDCGSLTLSWLPGGTASTTTAPPASSTAQSAETESTTKSADTEATTNSADTEATTNSADTEATTKSDDTETTTKSGDTETTTKSDDTETTTKSDDTETTTKSDDTETTTKSGDTETTTKSDDTETTTKSDDTETTTKSDDTETTTKSGDTETTTKTDDTETTTKSDDTETTTKPGDSSGSKGKNSPSRMRREAFASDNSLKFVFQQQQDGSYFLEDITGVINIVEPPEDFPADSMALTLTATGQKLFEAPSGFVSTCSGSNLIETEVMGAAEGVKVKVNMTDVEMLAYYDNEIYPTSVKSCHSSATAPKMDNAAIFVLGALAALLANLRLW